MWVVIFSIATAGCGQNEKRRFKNPDFESKGAEQSRLCKAYVVKICEIAGDESIVCKSIKRVNHLLPVSVCRLGIENIDRSVQKLRQVRKVCNDLIDDFCREIGPETSSCGFARREIEKISVEECMTMRKNYSQELATLRTREEMLNPLTAEKQKLISEGVSTAFGPETASLKIVTFSDFQSPYCAEGARVIRRIKDTYGDKVRVVFRHFPQPYHDKARLAAQASLAAAAQGKFWQYHDLLFKHQDKLDKSDLVRYARRLKLDINAFKKALDDERYKEAVDTDIQVGESVHVTGVPTTILNGTVLTNPTHFDLVAKEIDKALSKP
ncbi:MAG: DsbA family protein [Deltaproteobacteria bacterium]|nr:DsbA family protein [Deltaproteobacteria bacterium]